MLHDLIKIIMKVDMHLYDCIIIQILLIYLFIYLSAYLFSYFDSCFEKIYFIKNVLENGRTCYLVGVSRTVAQQC